MELVSLARNPIPSGAVVGQFKGYDGAPLRFARWEATRSPRRGTIVLFEGRGEFIEKYFEVIADLRRRGFAVAIHDWRGQGGSHRLLANRNKGHIRDFSQYDRDITRFMKEVVLPDCPPPYIALAHSMGGNILLRNSVVPGSWFERMVLCAPMLDLSRDKISGPARPGPLLRRGHERLRGEHLVCARRIRYARRSWSVCSKLPDLRRGALRAQPAGGGGGARSRLGLTNDRMAACGLPLEPHADAPGFRRACPRAAPAGERKRRHASSPASPSRSSPRASGWARTSLIASSRHEILQERDDIRARFWAAFDAYLGVSAAAA